MRRQGDHRAVVGRQLQRGQQDLEARGAEGRAEVAVGRHAASDHHAAAPAVPRRPHERIDQRMHDHPLERRRHIPPRHVRLALQEGGHGGLQTAEGELEPALSPQRDRQVDGGRVAAVRQAGERRAPGKTEVEEARDLVECLARRVVAGPAELLVGAPGRDVEQRRVPARRHQADERRLDARIRRARCDVPLEMVHLAERYAERPRQRLPVREPDQERAHQPGTVGGGHQVDIRPLESSVDEGAVEHAVDDVEVLARRLLGHDAAVCGV